MFLPLSQQALKGIAAASSELAEETGITVGQTYCDLQIRSRDQIEQRDGSNEAASQEEKPTGLLSRLSKKGSFRSLNPDEPDGGFFSDLAKNTE